MLLLLFFLLFFSFFFFLGGGVRGGGVYICISAHKFSTCSRAVLQYMGAAMFGLG